MEIEMSSIQEPQIVKPKDPPSVKIKEPDKADKYKIPPIDVTQAGTSMGAPKTPLSASMSARQDKERKIGHRRVNEAGEVTYKKKPTSELMAAVQLGIGQSIGGLASKPERDVLMQDFTVVESTFFPSEGSNLTPAHHHSDFRFKTYAPIAFRYFREMFAIQPDDFLSSLVSFPLQELSNPGASGSIFYLSEDDEFIIKTVQHKEAEFLQKLLPGYYMNLNQNPRTLLPKFYGLYCYQCGGKNIRFTVMNNLLPTEVRMHEKYDLKGSTYKRKASKHERAKTTPTLKDLDFLSNHPDGLLLEAETYNAFHKTMARDCRVLESFKIMDFSLLVGIHNLDQAARDRDQQRHASSHSQPSRTNDASSAASSATPRSQLHRGKSVKQRLAAYSTAMESIQADSEPVELENEEDVPLGGIPARNSKGERLLLYVGIIDILQSYRLKKKLEHGLKSLVHDGDTISVHRPSFYCNRFQNFFANIVFKKIPSPLKHSPSKKKGVAGRLRSVTEGDITLKTPDKSGGENKQRSASGAEEAGATGGRPDLLPTTSTPPPTFAEAVASSHSNSMSTTAAARSVGFRTSSLAESSVHAADLDNIPRSAYEQHRSQISPVSSGLADNDSMGMLAPSSHSPVHSISESTPTHTEYTEGTPSFTTSSPSCSSDVLDISLPDVHASVRDHHQRDGLDEQEVMQVSQLSTNSGESNVTVIYQQRGSVMTTTTTTTGHVATVTHSNGEQLSLIEGASKSQNSSSVAVGVGVVGRGCEESGDETSQETSYASAVESLATTTTAPPTHDSPTQKAPAQI